MHHTGKIFQLGLLALLLQTASEAQIGPVVPCEGCESQPDTWLPTSGPWANTLVTGSGLVLEVQNGTIAGFYFGYDAQGNPDWLLFSGELLDGNVEEAKWTLEADLRRFVGGSCPACEYQEPSSMDVVGSIRLEFFQRNHGTFQVDETPKQFMVPLLFGSAGFAHFEGETPYLLADLGRDFVMPSPWVLVLTEDRQPPIQPPIPKDWPPKSSLIVHIFAASVDDSDPNDVRVFYESYEREPVEDSQKPLVIIECGHLSEMSDVSCAIRINDGMDTKDYFTPIANIGADRFIARAADSDTVEGFRIRYN